MIIECKECAAPLDVEAGASLARCSYCGKTQRVRTARTQLPHTPPNWTPPAQWTPPPHAPARSVPLRYDASKKLGTVILVVVLVTTLAPIVIMGAVFGFIAYTTSKATSATPAPAPPPRVGSPPSTATPPIPATGRGDCAAAARCCKALGSAASGCENLAMVPDENACRQILESLRQTAKRLGKSCD